MRPLFVRLFLFALLLVVGASGASVLPAEAQAPEATPNDYGDAASWLCWPGRDDACSLDLSTTAVMADGSTRVESWSANPDAPVDCFYVYPTVSRDQAGNSDMTPGPGETGVVRSQLARFASECRVYAPMYRQITLAALTARLAGQEVDSDPTLSYGDVRDAWQHYLEHENDGRGVVLMGHSQGTGVLVQLIAAEIDGKPVQDRIVSALLLGNNVAVPQGADVGGSFQHVPLCRAATQTGCVITYMTFRESLPPEESFFGRVGGQNMVAGCNHPGALAGGSAPLDAYFGGGMFGGEPTEWTTTGAAIETEFVRVPGLVRGECVEKNGYAYLEVTVEGDPSDPRTDDIPGDLMLGGEISAVWGLHLIDVGIAMGDLLEVVRTQIAAYEAGS